MDLDSLSLVTGIKKDHLSQMEQGTLLPSDAHLDRLNRVLDADEVSVFLGHHQEGLEHENTYKGRLPEGTALIPYMRASDLQIGDLIAYHPPRKESGSSWVKVTELSVDDTLVLATVAGRQITLQSSQPIRIARGIRSHVNRLPDQGKSEQESP